MSVTPIQHGVFFSPRTELPRGRHALSREEAASAQKERLMAAFSELVAEHGLGAVTIGDLVGHTAVSRGAFYSCFDDLASCGDAAYDRFISVLLERLGEAMDPTDHWHEFVASAVRAYLETLQSDPVVSRAMQIEMDAAGRPARIRRQNALGAIAHVIKARYLLLQEEDASFGPLPEDAYLGWVYAVRQLACDKLENETDPDLLSLVDPIVDWIGATIKGAMLVQPDTASPTS